MANRKSREQLLAETSGKFNIWMRCLMEAVGKNPTVLERETSYSRAAISQSLRTNRWSELHIGTICAALGAPFGSRAEVEAAGFDLPIVWYDGRALRSGTAGDAFGSYVDGVEAMADADDPEETLNAAMRATNPDRPSFAAILSPMNIPVPLRERGAGVPGRVEAMYHAHDLGFQVLLVGPSPNCRRVLLELYDDHDMPDEGAFRLGFARYRDGYVRRRRDEGSRTPEDDADRVMMLLEADAFPVVGSAYTTTLVGESVGCGAQRMRQLDRGPETDHIISLCTPSPVHDMAMRKFVCLRLREARRREGNARITELFINPFILRLQGHA